jgi:hypothetical protein
MFTPSRIWDFDHIYVEARRVNGGNVLDLSGRIGAFRGK